METVNQFLSAFNQIEYYCKKSLSSSRYETMASMLIQLQKSNAIIRKFRNDLLEFAELRNAIVHSRKGNEVIAYPAEKAVREIELIRDKLLDPPIIKSLFAKKVITASMDEALSKVLSLFQKYDISQVPIVDQGKVVEVINGNTITRWLSKQAIVEPESHSVSELLPFIERNKNFKILPEKTDVYTCADLYSSSFNKGWYLDAILMTHSGKNGEGPTGIIVLEDIACYIS